MSTQTFARIWGILFLIIGGAGLVPGFSSPHSHPDIAFDTGLGLLLGVFPENLADNLIYLAFGAWGLVAGRSLGAAGIYGKTVAVTFSLFAILGLIPAANLWTLFGLAPLYGQDIWLHALLAAVALYAPAPVVMKGIATNCVSGPIRNAVSGEADCSTDCANPNTRPCRS